MQIWEHENIFMKTYSSSAQLNRKNYLNLYMILYITLNPHKCSYCSARYSVTFLTFPAFNRIPFGFLPLNYHTEANSLSLSLFFLGYTKCLNYFILQNAKTGLYNKISQNKNWVLFKMPITGKNFK